MERCRLALLSVGLTLAVAVSGALAQQGSPQKPARPPAPVVVSLVKAIREAPKAEYSGLIEPATKALLAADVAGRLVELVKQEGDRVEQGGVLAVLDNPNLKGDLAVLQARVKESEAQLVLSEQQQARAESLYRKKLTSAEKYEDGKAALAVVRAKLASDRAQVERLKDQLARMVIRSPIRGQVISANVELGQWITPNQPMFEIYNYDRFEVAVGVPGRFLTTVQSTGSVAITVPEIGRTLKGAIVAVVRHVDRSTGTFMLRIRVDNSHGLPLSGMLGKVELPLGKSYVLLTVPRDAIVRRGERTHVVAVEKGLAKIIPVQVKGNRGNAVIVTGKGLKPKVRVVVRGNERLLSGMAVKVAGTLPNHASGKL